MVHLQAVKQRPFQAQSWIMQSTMKVSEIQQERKRKASRKMRVPEQQSLLYLFLPAHHGLQILIHESKLLLQLSDSTGLVQHEQGMGERREPQTRCVPGWGALEHAFRKQRERENHDPPCG